MTRRTYGQFCAVARALDAVGERWTLLLVRELLLGPRRFTDLLAALPGLGTSLLAERLRNLESLGVVHREALPPPAGATVYRLTGSGYRLGPVVRALADWGAGLLDEPAPGEAFRADWVALYVATSAATVTGAPAATTGTSAATATAGSTAAVPTDPQPDETYELRVDDQTCHIRVEGGRPLAGSGPSPAAPALVIRVDRDACIDLGLGRADLRELVAAGRAETEGDADALARAARLFARGKNRPAQEKG